MTVQIKETKISTPNGHPISIIKFLPKIDRNQTIIISSATGVLQKYYAKFANYFALKGFTVYTFDYSGIGNSVHELKALKEHQSTLSSWGSNDQAAVVAFAKKENKESSITLIAHSVGGQIIGFNSNYDLIDKVILIAAQSGYWRDFRGIHLLKMWLLWHAIIPTLTPVFGYFPSKKLGLFENLPKNMVYEWASWGKQKKYMMHYQNNSDYFFDSIKVPILALSFYGDHFAPRKTVDWMSSQYRSAQLERVHHHTTKQEQQLKHFGFFKLPFKEPFWDNTLQWILTNKYQ